MKTMTSQLLQIIFNTDARVPSLPLIKATWLSFDFPSHSFFRSPLTLRGSRVGLLVGKRCALMQILMRSRRLSCTCAKYPAIGRVGCVSLHVGQTGRWRHMLLFDKPFISKGRMEELEMPKSVLTCFQVNKLALQQFIKPIFQYSTLYSLFTKPALVQQKLRSQCDLAEPEGQTGTLLCARQCGATTTAQLNRPPL